MYYNYCYKANKDCGTKPYQVNQLVPESENLISIGFCMLCTRSHRPILHLHDSLKRALPFEPIMACVTPSNPSLGP